MFFFVFSEKLETLIKKHCDESFNLSSDEFPSAICTTCRIILTKMGSGKSNKALPKFPEYHEIVIPKETRRKKHCNCHICQIASKMSPWKHRKGRGICKIPTKFNVNKESIQKSENTNMNDKIIKLCNICKSKVGRGLSHHCKVKTAPTNMLNILELMPEKQHEMLTSTLLHK